MALGRLHRHIGGLENQMIAREAAKMIHRHTGGLESLCVLLPLLSQIHRHTGGWVLISKTVKFIYFY